MAMAEISKVIAIRDILEVFMALARCAPLCSLLAKFEGGGNNTPVLSLYPALPFSVMCVFGGYETPRCEQMQGRAKLLSSRETKV